MKEKLEQVHNQRKRDNSRNMKAYFKIIDFIKDRSKGIDAVLPTKFEIQILEVFKKLTESGWIVKKTEFNQILDFVGIGQ